MYACTKPCGRIVTLVPPTVKNNDSQKYVQFREWVDILEADFVEIPRNSFGQNTRGRTGAAAILLVIDKPQFDPLETLVENLNENFPNSGLNHQEAARQLFNLSREIFRVKIIDVNDRNLTPAEEDELESYEEQARAIVRALGTKCSILSDIRGYIIKLFLPSGRFNCGAGHGWWGI
jgi:hypothetical protein